LSFTLRNFALKYLKIKHLSPTAAKQLTFVGVKYKISRYFEAKSKVGTAIFHNGPMHGPPAYIY